MFLNLMNDDERKDFLELIYKIATCDGEYADEEKSLVNNYKKELELSEIPETKSMEELVSVFSAKPDQLKRILYFEILGMVMADSKAESEEEKILNLIQEQFGLGERVYAELNKAAEKLQAAYDAVYSIIFD